MGIAGGRNHQRIRRPSLISRFRIFWAFGGIVFVVIGAIGVVLPLLPTTPFLLLAAYCFARSSPRLHDWLLTHKTFGPLIKNWDEYGSIDPRAKRIAIVVILLTPLIAIAIGVPWWALAAQLIVLGIASTFILTRPDPPTQG